MTAMSFFFSLHPSQIDQRPLIAFLEKHKVDPARRDQMLNDVNIAIGRYGHAQENERLKYRLQTVRTAAEKLCKVMPKLGSKEYIRFLEAIVPPVTVAETAAVNKHLQALHDLEATLALICNGAAAALDKLEQPGSPTKATTIFAAHLAEAWTRGTGEKPHISGSTTFEKPNTTFSQFVTIAAGMLPDAAEFKRGFAELLRRAVKVSKQSQKPEVSTLM
ncbi:MAG: hypothetical protein WDN46_08685 [Methylocella sp.]